MRTGEEGGACGSCRDEPLDAKTSMLRAVGDSECGICHDVSDVRGVLDSCEHTFCYPCISKWSSIESRCPYCRVRFSVIRQSRSDGTVLAEEQVPVRDQRAIFENREFIDWLESVRCVVCNGSDAEDRLLLCDGCDQASHTFCVGLDSVPEDAWFCSQCETARRTVQTLALVDTESPSDRMQRSRRTRVQRLRIDLDSSSPEIEEVPETAAPPARRRPRLLLIDDTDSDDIGGSVVDLTSPVRSISDVSPPILDLRSRLRSQLLSSSSTPRSPVPRSGGVTTVSDLTFATNVAAGRRTATPASRSAGRTFAQHAEAMARERLSGLRTPPSGPFRCANEPEAVVVSDKRGDQAGTSTRTSCSDPGGSVELARALVRVKARMDEKLGGITLPHEMIRRVQTTAASLVVADADRWSVSVDELGRSQLDDAIDEALREPHM